MSKEKSWTWWYTPVISGGIFHLVVIMAHASLSKKRDHKSKKEELEGWLKQ
jgi:hypothetical protein